MTPVTSSHAPTGRRAARSIVAIACVAIVLLSFAGPAAALTVPSTGAMFGAHVESSPGMSFVSSVRAFEQRLGRNLAIVNKFHDWSMTNVDDERTLTNSGHLVMVSWH